MESQADGYTMEGRKELIFVSHKVYEQPIEIRGGNIYLSYSRCVERKLQCKLKGYQPIQHTDSMQITNLEMPMQELTLN